MARRPLKPMEPRGSIESPDPRVKFLPVPNARKLVVVTDLAAVPASDFQGALVWLKPQPGFDDQAVLAAEVIAAAGAAAVRILPGPVGDAPLPLEVAANSTLSDVSEVRPVVAELISALEPALQPAVTEYVEELLASQGL